MYHIGKNNKPGVCEASPGNCPLKSEHWETLKEASSMSERRNAAGQEYLKKVKKPNTLSPIEIALPEGSSEVAESLKATLKLVGSEYSNEVETLIKTLEHGEIPEVIPHEISRNNYGEKFSFASSIAGSALQEFGYYARITKKWATTVKSLDVGRVLDPFAGAGWAAKALREQGIPTIYSDNGSWHQKNKAEKLEAVDSLRKYANEIDTVLISWVPYGDSVDMRLWKVIQEDYPHLNVVLIGEGSGGCTGSEEFMEMVEGSDGWEYVDYETTSALNDYCSLYRGAKVK